MDIDKMEGNNQVEQHHVDTSRPFSSVKEAVAIFGQRIMLPVQTHTVNSKPVSPFASHIISQPVEPRSLNASPSISRTAEPRSHIASRSSSQTVKLVSPTGSPSVSQTAKPVSPTASPSINQTASSPSSPWKQRSLFPSSPQGPKEEIMDVLKKLEAIIPLVGDFFFFKKKGSATEISGPLYTTSSTLHF